MKNLSEDARAIVAANLTLAFFIREHTMHTVKPELRKDSREVVEDMFREFIKTTEI